MTELIVISDDDLEEGEIAEEIEVEPVVEIKPKPRSRKLPRRYNLHENKELNSKHSKHRRRSSHHHRKHHKCPRHLEHNKLGSNFSNCIKNSSSRSNKESPVSSTLSTKSAFKNYSSPRREPAKKQDIPQKSPNKGESVLKIPVPVPTFEKLNGNEAKKTTSEVSKDGSVPKQNSDSLNVSKLVPNTQSIKFDESYSILNNEEDEDEDEEELRRIALATCLDEDEEELRRIALATCLKVPISDSPQVFEKGTVEPVVNGLNNKLSSSNKTPNLLQNNCDIYLPGNNEVIDMELDSDCSDDLKSDLFVIDRNPLNSKSFQDLPKRKFNHSPSELYSKVKPASKFQSSDSQNLSSEDIEEAALRAQVIASMHSSRQQLIKEVPPKPFPALSVGNVNKALPYSKNKVQNIQNRKVVRSLQPYFKPSVNFLNMKRVVNKAKLNYLKSLNHKRSPLLPQRRINAGPERLVITLSNDSSSEESEEENDESKGELENSIASIEALISDARQKSDFVKNNDSNNVSCLSKAQQEEYNNLKKILAEKELVMPKKTSIDADRKRVCKILSREVMIAQNNWNKEVEMLTSCEKELNEKKQEYMTSKLKAQLLKEQLHAAEVVRAANLEAWKKTAAKLDIQKKSVSKHKAIVDLLEKKLSTQQLPPKNSVLTPNRNLDLAT